MHRANNFPGNDDPYDLERETPRCETMVCGNYDRQYDNYCRALTGAVPDDPFDCAAFCSFAEATAVDRRALAACKRRRDYEPLRKSLNARDNPRRRPPDWPEWPPDKGHPMGK